MTEPRDLQAIRLSQVVRVREDPGEPVGVIVYDTAGARVDPINMYLRDVFANGASLRTCRSYAYALVRWWRFLDAVEIP
ncbi:hypothetical protein [Leifsonia soli]|uniref:Integrase n=1 Tax=Leifsonia soli TaxID=582665 RepID=A0A852SYJ1_9MICO|nr:hypothetical protein [Leifsonia soli]NYD74199.1 hypothetical protein [Leifsonia soli]